MLLINLSICQFEY